MVAWTVYVNWNSLPSQQRDNVELTKRGRLNEFMILLWRLYFSRLMGTKMLVCAKVIFYRGRYDSFFTNPYVIFETRFHLKEFTLLPEGSLYKWNRHKCLFAPMTYCTKCYCIFRWKIGEDVGRTSSQKEECTLQTIRLFLLPSRVDKEI